MKQILIVICIIQTLVLEKTYSQQYFPMVYDSVSWNVTTVNFALNPWDQDSYNTNRYGIFGDTIINTIPYKKVYSINCYSENFNQLSSTYFGAIREDSSKKVYFFKNNVESLQYDFSLNVGDTFHYSSSYTSADLLVESINYVQINGENRKQFNVVSLYSGWTHPWIEGVGSTASLVDYVYPWGNFDVHLSCYFNNFNLVYGQSTNCCQGVTSIKESENKTTNISLYPNPVNNVLKLEFQTVENRQIEIFNYEGKIIEKINTNDTFVAVDTKEYPEGIFLIKITNDKDVKNLKFIRINSITIH